MMHTLTPLALVFLLVNATPIRSQEAAPGNARAAFDRLKQLAGEWDQRSTKDWEGTASVQVIAGGSALLFLSKVDPHPASNETMATVFHMDGDRLMLTHYCVARNQPRLVATSISDDGRTIEFTLRDATNMSSPGAGVMNKAVYTIESSDRYRSRWTFSQQGKERWMEEIVTTRRR